MLEIKVSDLHWVRRTADEPDDQCAHGDIDIVLDGVSLLASHGSGAAGANRSASATALNLLYALFEDHQPSGDDVLVPCCGHAPYEAGGGRVMFMNCCNGGEMSVRHDGSEVVLGEPAHTARVSGIEWRHAVLNCVGRIEAFYAARAPKVRPAQPHKADAWAAFWSEWKRLKKRAEADPSGL